MARGKLKNTICFLNITEQVNHIKIIKSIFFLFSVYSLEKYSLKTDIDET